MSIQVAILKVWASHGAPTTQCFAKRTSYPRNERSGLEGALNETVVFASIIYKVTCGA